ncbi:D-alanyl-D-alanine carboxypeptidase family protein [Methylomonas sp. MED-D]|uniref:serine-type D-Ala-D-Ala carboxypeptidase n=1 Tax=Methylomonas koyamae TaxID=702114 RepID=A0A177NHK9_9GAMM|nr:MULTISPECIES: D-alanyl-D-alanine carboxypeptidase family protein [Methylomonas]NJA07626.1 D-alanyl-D-alanine carboxypeptidase [Methylococcaceae bacterium WWC4]MDT4332605.1 D-alanyl-D-alanine carboxypeptidase family protein [Methylomonas sp. MV1]OAI17345.1 D-alanyl-D-alanine carboxypeptidase [Methylomonas koyamae]OHX34590.1 serine-type D-Ala-D-Ala carboxypeptidase [Methylomonas sp. LWB]WGS85236.1 D-alanyl-D-alanine carboxypeptidase family protein [Methylomonas sp. UP202]
MRPSFRTACSLLFGLSLMLTVASLQAASPIFTPAAPSVAASSYFLMDFNSSRVLAEKDPDKRVAPASLTKIMTVYVVFRELKAGHLTLDEKVTISQNAWETGGSKMFVEVNKQVAVEDLLQGVVIQSGNDASVALAEHVAGSEQTFATMMNEQASRLGMANSHFENATGLPSPNHYSSARDLALLAQAVIKEFPEYYRWDSQKEFTFNGITQQNRNLLLWRDPSVDGLKTGFTDDAGYCMVASAKREDMRLISVVMGTASPNARSNESQSLLNYGFRFFETHRLYEGNKALSEARVRKGVTSKLPVGLAEDLYVTAPRKHFSELKAESQTDKAIVAPLNKGDTVGSLVVSLAGETVVSKPLVALEAIAEGGLFRRLYDAAIGLLEKE